jgi:capping protein alpha
MSEVSSEDVKKIVNGFLLNAPPGEFHEVVTDVRGLLKNDDILNELAPTTFKEYNTEQMLVVKLPEGEGDHKVLITKYGEINPNEYLDPHGKKVITFDHFKQEVSGSRDASESDIDPDVEPYRVATERKIFEYIENHFDHGAATVYGSKEGSNHVVSVAISSAIFNSTNFYNGRWRSAYSIKYSPGKKADFEGSIRNTVHYYEDGNVQLNTNCVKKRQGLPATNPDGLAEAVVKAITEIETEFQNQLEISYEKMGSTTFKALRRALPVVGTKLNWPKLGQYKIGSEIKK